MTPEIAFEQLLDILRQEHPEDELDIVRRAYVFARDAHQPQKRASGEPYIIHPIATAVILAEMHLPVPIIVAGLLHDVPEDTQRTLEDIEREFGSEVARLIAGITKLGKIKYRGIERYIENLRKMFLAMAEDVRVVVIKFADRLHNLQTLDAIPPKKQYRVALESLEIYAPIAGRLGMGDMKGRLEDAAFKYVFPQEYLWTKNIVDTSETQRKTYLDDVMTITRSDLKHAGIQNFEVIGRAKHLYSTYRKLLKHERNINRIYDLMAIRVMVDNVADCYATLGIIHGKWTPLKGRIKDYIAQPKPNGYHSLHTTVFCKDGEIVEFQIRTYDMHRAAEYGIAAHWVYSENGKNSPVTSLDSNIDWMKQLTDFHENNPDNKAYLSSLEDIKIDIFKDRAFMFTPQGDVIDLPEDSTPVDFAYAIHTDIGNTCIGAKVNNDVAPLDRKLKNGDMVEIMTDKNRKGPNVDWLRFVRTHYAKTKIRQNARASLASWIKGVLPKLGK